MKRLIGLTGLMIVFGASLAFGAASVWDFVDGERGPDLPNIPDSIGSLHIMDLWDPGGFSGLGNLVNPGGGLPNIQDLWDRAGGGGVQDLWVPPGAQDVWDFEAPSQPSGVWDFSPPPGLEDEWWDFDDPTAE